MLLIINSFYPHAAWKFSNLSTAAYKSPSQVHGDARCQGPFEHFMPRQDRFTQNRSSNNLDRCPTFFKPVCGFFINDHDLVSKTLDTKSESRLWKLKLDQPDCTASGRLHTMDENHPPTWGNSYPFHQMEENRCCVEIINAKLHWTSPLYYIECRVIEQIRPLGAPLRAFESTFLQSHQSPVCWRHFCFWQEVDRLLRQANSSGDVISFFAVMNSVNYV